MLGYYILGLHAVASLIIILLVAFEDYKKRRNQVFILATTIFTLLSVANAFSLETTLDQLFFIRMVMISASLAVLLLFLLIKSVRSDKIFQSHFSRFLLVFTAVVVAIDASPLLFVGYKAGVPPQPIPGPLAGLFFIHFVLITTATIVSLRKYLKAAKGREVEQYRMILIGLMPILVLAPITSFILPLVFQITNFIVISPLYTVFFILCVGYAIIRHGLFDIRAAAVRSSAYVLSLLTLGLIYYALAYLISVTVFQNQTTLGVSVSPINVLLALLLAFIFQPIKSFFDKTTNKIFYRDRYDSSEFYLRLNEVLTGTNSLEQLLKDAAKELQSTLKSEQVFFAVAHSRSDYIQSGTLRHHRMPVKDIHDINRLVESQGDAPIITSLLSGDDRHIRRILLSHKIELLMPLVRHGAIIGYLLLGEQRTGGYAKRDLRVLETISDELVIAIQHSLSVEEVKNINQHLEQRIETATAELRTSNARLKRLDTAKDEFLSMASHQLRTPLTSVKGYLSMVLEGDVGKTTAMQKKVLEEAFSSSERMVHLIHDFLNVSRLQTGKFMLELQPTNLAKLIEEEVKSLKSAAKSRSMTIEFTNKAGDVQMQLDDTKIRQVVMNYIDNAIYYSHPETTILVELAKKDDRITLKVKDTGIGVPANEQAQLFGKFYRATNARKQRPDGTGVGLYLAKKVVTALGGDVLFTSKLGKGSTFGFYLPVQVDQVALEKKNTNKLK